MKIVLLKDVKGIGRRDEMREVSDGYARNLLIPRKLALPATPQVQVAWERRRAKREQEQEERIAAFHESAKKLGGAKLQFSLKVGEKGEVFGSVSDKDIEGALEREGFSNVHVLLRHPLKTVGDHTIEVDFGDGVKSSVAATITPES